MAPKRLTKEFTIGKVHAICEALPYEKAEDSLPDVASFVARALEQIRDLIPAIAEFSVKGSEDVDMAMVWKLLPLFAPALVKVADQMGNGTLKRLAPLILASTEVRVPDENGKMERLELMKASDRATLFDQHPEAYFPLLFLAGKVTYGRFFPVLGLKGKGAPKAG